ncbi:TKL/MLK protein kinase [Phytophthora cinnamomi]|uniref:TKL/MLK protein kinase n=1 Tax=Phytophthora cinnamomi TaxID=4785 RepID=UPI003559D7F0|nr:TKL/MLK protein kinase [Phytophthora cinnamomi]
MLLPELRKSIKHVNDFLDEVRLLAMLEHPRIVHFVGIAWDSLSDLCAVLEYMEGGDLRALLASYEAQGHELGFDRTKVTIALHVAHALTYLHSLDPPVLHRDLKSKNILLTSDLEAKLTDFGISRERVDKTMTAGVGTSLWMAPEVMMGERYDGKADVFSFGVVLSELDLHSLPYAHAKENSDSGRKMLDTAILQMVALGKIRVEFSPRALDSMVALANTCVALNPDDRPTAAEALYYLQTILRDEL